MKRLALLGILVAIPAFAQMPYGIPLIPGAPQAPYGTGSSPQSHYTQGYTTQRGTIVTPHYETAPNTTQMDNFNTRGNVNPYTGAVGTRTPRW